VWITEGPVENGGLSQLFCVPIDYSNEAVTIPWHQVGLLVSFHHEVKGDSHTNTVERLWKSD